MRCSLQVEQAEQKNERIQDLKFLNTYPEKTEGSLPSRSLLHVSESPLESGLHRCSGRLVGSALAQHRCLQLEDVLQQSSAKPEALKSDRCGNAASRLESLPRDEARGGGEMD